MKKLCAIAVVASVALLSAQGRQEAMTHGPSIGAEQSHTQYSTAADNTPTNVDPPELAWAFDPEVYEGGAGAGGVTPPPPAQASVYQGPRTQAGQPDLSGIWQVLSTAAWNIQTHNAEEGVPAGLSVVVGDEIPYQPWAATQKQENYEDRMTADPVRQCYLPGVPRITYMPFPFQIVQTPTYVVITYEFAHTVRIIYTDGSPHPLPNDFWMGDSRGYWAGDTLVVDTTHFNDRTWFDAAGNFHSDALHVVERYTPTSPYHIKYEVTIEDPKVFTRPWQMSMPVYRRVEEGLQVLDYDCVDFIMESKY